MWHMYNGLDQWPYFLVSHTGGLQWVVYLMGSPTFALHISRIFLSHHHLQEQITLTSFLAWELWVHSGEECLITHTPPPCIHTTYHDIHFDHNLSPLYSTNLSNLLTHIDDISPLDDWAILITSSLHEASLHTNPHTNRSTCLLHLSSVPCNRWYNDECKALVVNTNSRLNTTIHGRWRYTQVLLSSLQSSFHPLKRWVIKYYT